MWSLSSHGAAHRQVQTRRGAGRLAHPLPVTITAHTALRLPAKAPVLEALSKWYTGGISWPFCLAFLNTVDGIQSRFFSNKLPQRAVPSLSLSWKTQQWPQDWKRSVFVPIPKKGNAKECSNYCIIAIISHSSKVMLKKSPSQASSVHDR